LVLTFTAYNISSSSPDRGVDGTLEGPYQLLDGVIQVQTILVLSGVAKSDRFRSVALQLIDQVLVGSLSHTATLICVQVHVIDPERGVCEGNVRAVGNRGGVVRGATSAIRVEDDDKLVSVAKLHVDFHFMARSTLYF
jgi:hypothetical protein